MIAASVPAATWQLLITALIIIWCTLMAGGAAYLYMSYHLTLMKTAPWWATLVGEPAYQGLSLVAQAVLAKPR